MKPLDEESVGSNSSVPSPVSAKKEVRFAETPLMGAHNVLPPIFSFFLLVSDT